MSIFANILFNKLSKTLSVFDKQWQSPLEIIIVDDGSKDNSVQKIEEAFAGAFSESTSFELIQLGKNQGKGAALKKGVERSTGDFVLTIDADMAAEPGELGNWLASLPEKTFPEDKILIGSREHESSKVSGQFIRRIAGLVYNFIIQLFTNLNLTDTQCGFKVYSKAVANNLFGQLKTKGWAGLTGRYYNPSKILKTDCQVLASQAGIDYSSPSLFSHCFL